MGGKRKEECTKKESQGRELVNVEALRERLDELREGIPVGEHLNAARDWAIKECLVGGGYFQKIHRQHGWAPDKVAEMLLRVEEFVRDIVAQREGNGEPWQDWRYTFELARELWAWLERCGYPREPVDRDMRPLRCFVELFRHAVLDWEIGEYVDFEDSQGVWLEFVRKWEDVERPAGSDPFARALELARARPITIQSERSGLADVTLAASIAYYLQVEAGMDAEIYVPVQRLGMACGRVGKEAAATYGSRVLAVVRSCGLLVKSNVVWTPGHLCQRYRFLLKSENFSPPNVNELHEVS